MNRGLGACGSGDGASRPRNVAADVLDRTAGEIAEMVRRKEVSARELAELLFARIDERNPALNAVAEQRREAALAEAAAADDTVSRGGELGPLHGVPMTIKESFDVAGMQTTWGNPAFKDHVAETDSTVATRLRAAGAIIVGKTNVPFMLSDNQTANPIHGVTNNPHDPTRTPGGSSGGAAAALAAGMTFLEFGSDLSGSIRNPASFCGVYGLRPSTHLVPSTGYAPPGPPQASADTMPLLSIGPLARSAADLRVALRATAGPETPMTPAFSWSLPEPRHTDMSDFRVGFALDHDRYTVSTEISDILSNTIDHIAHAGAKVVQGWPPDIDPVVQFEDFQQGVQASFALIQNDPMTHASSIELALRRAAARAAWADYFDRFDVFLSPVNMTVAYPHDNRPFEQRTVAGRRYSDQFFWTAYPAQAGLPAVVAPAGQTRAGLPVGIQIVGPPYEEDTPLTFADLVRFER